MRRVARGTPIVMDLRTRSSLCCLRALPSGYGSGPGARPLLLFFLAMFVFIVPWSVSSSVVLLSPIYAPIGELIVAI